jgi:NADP-dependent 3-hydroxy acid dehydrogenase YdfG
LLLLDALACYRQAPMSVEPGLNIVTGASSGIGRSLARRLAADGVPVALLARRKELLDSLADEIRAAGGQAIAIACDVTDPTAVREAVRAAEERFGPTARLLANAGGAGGKAAGVFDSEHFRHTVELNLMSVVHCVAAVLPGMLERRAGHLVAISSLAGYRGLPGSAAYSAAKGGLTNFLESLRIDLRGSGVDVTVIAPGFVRTTPGGKKRKPFVMELEPATERIHRAVRERRGFYAFPRSLVALIWLGRVLPVPLYDRVLAGRRAVG